MSDQEQLMDSLKKQVRSLLMPAKEGLTPFQLEEDYKSLIGKWLPFRALGYHSLMELLKDMPDVVKICPKGNGNVLLKAIADECTKEIASLVAKQKSRPKPHSSRQRLNLSFLSTRRGGLSWHSQASPNLPRRGRLPPILPAIVKSELKELLRTSPVLLSDFDKAFFQRFGRTFQFVRYGFFSMSEVLNAASDIITIVQTRTGSLLTLKDSSPKKQTEKLPNVIQPDQSKQILATTVETPVVNITSLAPGLSMNDQSETPKEESAISVPELKVEPPLVKSGERIKQLQKDMKTVLANKGPGGVVSSELKEKIKTIVAQYPEGLLASKLSHEFEVHFKEALPVRELGFLNLMELIGALSDTLYIECKEGEKDWLIFDTDSQRLKDDDEENDKTVQSDPLVQENISDEHRLPCWDFPVEDTKSLETKFSIVTKMVTPYLGMEKSCIMQELMEKEIPPDAAQDRSLYSLPEFETSALVGVFVEHIVSPSQFYVRIFSAETSDKLEDMMIEMRRCYSCKNVADRYTIPETLIQPGQLCCIGNSKGKWWYRVIIHRIVDDQKVEVFYADFGNMGIVQKSDLRFLKYCYAKLPAQAVPCSLAWVKCTEDDWTANAILEFQKLCGVKLLVGVVDEYIDGVLHLFLCDTSSNEDIYLHNVLRLEGHVLICRENISSKGFQNLNPTNLYMKPSQKQKAHLKEEAVSLFQQESSGGLAGTTDSGLCESEVVIQRFDTRENSESDQLEKGSNSFIDCNGSGDVQESCLFKSCYENSRLEQNETKDIASEMPYLEPVYLCKEIWDESWIPSEYCGEKKNCDTGADLCSDTARSYCQAPSNKESKNDTQHSQDVTHEKKEETLSAAETITCPNLEPLSLIMDSSGRTEAASCLGAAPDSLSQTLDEFYISIAHSEKFGELCQVGVDVNSYTSESLPSTSALHGETSSDEKMDEASRTQVVALCSPSCYRGDRAVDHNALVFTAELQGSPTFCVPCSPAVALGASARLASAGGYFSLSRRKLKT
ncbi:tudor domain-containing protein 5 isoform X2 [Sceloporus undulatus]|uniref:tudor domain-containing protein 5 isoform X2 n=1 Tax=Sceloporus undulatus TaxID=8520 RepID=UPI001C4D2339|nr:tudor domain-containing protein 5 isoform X2 [Sceloporus undulatus]